MMTAVRCDIRCILASLFSLLVASTVSADGSMIDKIYHPYVDQLEWELEWRTSQEYKAPEHQQKRRQKQRLGLGKSVAEFVFVEAYLIAEGSADESLNIQAYEVEALWQLTEQGEYDWDYGLLFEIEKARASNAWEYATTLLLERELGRFSTTANLSLIYEWGEDTNDEWETALSLQARYRYSPRFEPALEWYMGEDTSAAGPVIMGREVLAVKQALRWELGSIFGLNNDTADYTLRAAIEYEF